MQPLEEAIQKMKRIMNDRLSDRQKMEVLKAVMIADPSIQAFNGRGHVSRCPNGHMYIIGECGQAMQQGRCPDCGAGIGGRSHVFAAGNSRLTDDEATRMGWQ